MHVSRPQPATLDAPLSLVPLPAHTLSLARRQLHRLHLSPCILPFSRHCLSCRWLWPLPTFASVQGQCVAPRESHGNGVSRNRPVTGLSGSTCGARRRRITWCPRTTSRPRDVPWRQVAPSRAECFQAPSQAPSPATLSQAASSQAPSPLKQARPCSPLTPWSRRLRRSTRQPCSQTLRMASQVSRTDPSSCKDCSNLCSMDWIPGAKSHARL